MIAEFPGRPHLRLSNNGELVKLVRDRLEVMAFDLAGRLLSTAMHGSVFRRGLDGTVLRIDRLPVEERFHQVTRLAPDEVEWLHREVRQRLVEASPRLGSTFASLTPTLELARHDDERTFRRLYRGVGILPPDCYRAMVLNLTEGCSYNRCRFCSFYKDRPFRVRSPQEFGRHLEDVLRAFGPALPYRRGVFLGQANAASLPTQVLAEALTILRGRLPVTSTDRQFQEVSAFLDTFTRPTRSPDEWAELRRLGLSRLYLGVETGSLPVLKLLGKPGSPRFVRMLVERLKQAGMAVSVIILSGAGGRQMAEDHVRETALLLNHLPLSRGDRVYISELVVGSEYADLDLDHLDRHQCRLQTRELRARLTLDGPLVSLYDVRQFVY